MTHLPYIMFSGSEAFIVVWISLFGLGLFGLFWFGLFWASIGLVGLFWLGLVVLGLVLSFTLFSFVWFGLVYFGLGGCWFWLAGSWGFISGAERVGQRGAGQHLGVRPDLGLQRRRPAAGCRHPGSRGSRGSGADLRSAHGSFFFFFFFLRNRTPPSPPPPAFSCLDGFPSLGFPLKPPPMGASRNDSHGSGPGSSQGKSSTRS